MDFFTKLLTLLFFVAQIYCDCNVCQLNNNVACRNENQFSLCMDGNVTENFITCPENYVCSSGPKVCYPLTEATPSCIPHVNLCGVCNENKVYACLNETTFTFCMGHEAPIEGIIFDCPENTVCDINSTQGYCTSDTLVQPSCVGDYNDNGRSTTMEPTTIKPNCYCTTNTTEPNSTLPTTTTTTNPSTTSTTSIFDPEVFCVNAGLAGSYKYDRDESCTLYVLCTFWSNKMYGLLKLCDSGRYFDTVKKICVSEKPEGCL